MHQGVQSSGEDFFLETKQIPGNFAYSRTYRHAATTHDFFLFLETLFLVVRFTLLD